MKALKFLAVSAMVGGLFLSSGTAVAKDKTDPACKGFYVGKMWLHEQKLGLFGMNTQNEEMKIVGIDKEEGQVSIEITLTKKYDASAGSAKESYNVTCQELRDMITEMGQKP